MSKYEIARWLTPGLTPIRLVFITYGGSTHGDVIMESQEVESGNWSKVERIGGANGIPTTKVVGSSTDESTIRNNRSENDCEGEKVDESHINQFTGEEVA